MRIDNTAAVTYRRCPRQYQERFERNLERIYAKEGVRPLDLGVRVHELLEEHYNELAGHPIVLHPESENLPLEYEAQALVAAYKNHYPVDLDAASIVDVERTFEVPLKDEISGVSRHTVVGKFDVVYKDPELGGMLCVMDHKTEKRSALRNLPEAWAAKSQASVYLYAAEQLYGLPVRHLTLNVLRRQSDKGQVGPEFPPRQTIQRSPAQIKLALRDLIEVADTIELYRERYEDAPWPSHTDMCMEGRWQCAYYPLHTYPTDPFALPGEELLKLYEPAKPYLDL